MLLDVRSSYQARRGPSVVNARYAAPPARRRFPATCVLSSYEHVNGIHRHSIICSSTSSKPPRAAIDVQGTARQRRTVQASGSKTVSGTTTPHATNVRATAFTSSARVASSSVTRKIQFARSSIGVTSAARPATFIAKTSANGAHITVPTRRSLGCERLLVSDCCRKPFNTRAAPQAPTETSTP